MLDYEGGFYYSGDKRELEHREVYEFESDLEIVDSHRGRSSVRVTVRDTRNGEHYSMGFSTFFDACKTLTVMKGVIFGGKWTFKKQGSNFGLVMVGSDVSD